MLRVLMFIFRINTFVATILVREKPTFENQIYPPPPPHTPARYAPGQFSLVRYHLTVTCSIFDLNVTQLSFRGYSSLTQLRRQGVITVSITF